MAQEVTEPYAQGCLGVPELFSLLVGKDLWVVTVQLEDDPVHLLLAQATLSRQERSVLYQPVTVGLICHGGGHGAAPSSSAVRAQAYMTIPFARTVKSRAGIAL